jgi:hypothetical protein
VEDMEMESVDRKDCWRCHTIFHWPQLRQIKGSNTDFLPVN